MTDIERRLPSVPEVMELASLVPSSKPPCPNIARLLQPLIDICRPQWVSDFLFTPEPIHIDHFLSPTFASKAFVCAYKTTRIEAASLQPDPEPLYEETHHLDGRYLFLPAFTVADITLGFGGMEIMSNAGPFWQTNFVRKCGAFLPLRFVRDTKQNTFLELFDIPMDDAVMVFLTRYISPTHTHTVSALFTRSKLLASMREQSDRDIINKLIESLRFITEEDQTRGCHICHAPPGGLCICSLQTSRPAHPFDSKNFANAMLQHLGVHQSLSNKVLFESGTQGRHVVMGSRMLMQGSIDPGFVQGVTSWVATEYLSLTASANPRSLMPRVSNYVEALGDIFTMDESKLEIIQKPSNAKAPTDETFLQNLIDDVLEHQELESETVQVVPAMNLELQVQPETGPFDGIDISGDSLPDVQPLHPGYTFTLAANADDMQEEWWTERCATNKAQTVPDSTMHTNPESDKSTSRPAPNTPSTGSDVTRQGMSSPPVTQKTESPDEKLIAKRIKAKQRREKNRLCAQRSNKRAKATRDALKGDLQSSKERVELLRSKEMALRQANLALRRSISEQGK